MNRQQRVLGLYKTGFRKWCLQSLSGLNLVLRCGHFLDRWSWLLTYMICNVFQCQEQKSSVDRNKWHLSHGIWTLVLGAVAATIRQVNQHENRFYLRRWAQEKGSTREYLGRGGGHSTERQKVKSIVLDYNSNRCGMFPFYTSEKRVKPWPSSCLTVTSIELLQLSH